MSHVLLGEVPVWIHVTATRPGGKKAECWYSRANDVVAQVDDDRIEYRDRRLRVYYVYAPRANVLYRVPETTPYGREDFARLVASVRAALEGSGSTADVLAALELAGNDRVTCELVRQHVEEVDENGKKWIDYRLAVILSWPARQPDSMELSMLFRSDPATGLLHWTRFESDGGGQHAVMEQHFVYPATGPADIFALGVPREATLIDRTPSGDLAQILRSHHEGRTQMEDYQAVIVLHDEASWRPHGMLEILYRKGNRFRRDTAIWTNPSWVADPRVQWPGDRPDAGQWWNQCVKDHCWLLPQWIDGPSASYTVDSRWTTDPDGSSHVEITSLKRRDRIQSHGEFLPLFSSWLPEFACRPPMGIPHETMEIVLDRDPQEGPAGTVLLRVRRAEPAMTCLQGCGCGTARSSPVEWRYWLDPERDYIVVRQDIVGEDCPDGRNVHTTIMDRIARSPQGTWYATRIRRKDAIGTPYDDRRFDEILDIYVDFDASLPDSLFDLPSPGRIH